MTKGLVLITGVNGYVAARTAKYLLDSGYSVRGTVRNLSSAKLLLEDALNEYAQDGRFTVIQVPDITAAGAFDEAVKDVTAIAHLAAPVSFSFTDPTPILHAATTGTTTILTSALTSSGPQLKTVILMSSIAATTTNHPPPYTLTEKDWNTFALPLTAQKGTQTPGPIIYSASKVASERAFWAFRDEKNPPFTMTSINPVFVIGPPLVAPKTAFEIGETYAAIWHVFAGNPYPEPMAGLPYVVDVRDVAKLVLYPVEHPEESDGERYIASSAVGHPQAIADILRRAFPEARGRIVEGSPGEGYREGYGADKERVVVVDASKGEKVVGGWIPYEDSVVDTAKALKALL